MKVTNYIAEYLERRGVKFIFELSGGMITHLIDAIVESTKIKIVAMHHEQSTAFAAQAIGMVTDVPGVAMATSGPGATNLVTGIASCHFDSVPCVFITGQVNTNEIKGQKQIRQLGFQETDIVSMVRHITKASFLVKNVNDIPEIITSSFEIATKGRPGPVLIDIPMDIQRSELLAPTYSLAQHTNKKRPALYSKPNQVIGLISAIKTAKKPIILAGRGVRAGKALLKFRDFVKSTGIPVVTSLLGLDILPADSGFRVGFIGSYGNRWANKALGNCDLLIVLGARLDIRQTGADVNHFKNRLIYHVDIEKSEINNRIKGCKAICCSLIDFFNVFETFWNKHEKPLIDEWYEYIQNERSNYPDTLECKTTGINPNKLIKLLSEKLQDNSVCYLADVGNHQMWAAQSLRLSKDTMFLTSGGMGAMGFALPAAIGACFALPKWPIVAIIGDGSMQINIQELQTIKRNNLPVKIIVFNNNSLGMIRQFQDAYFESRYHSTMVGYSAPDFSKISKAYGIASRTICKESEVSKGLKWLCKPEYKDIPQLLQIMLDSHANAYPKIAFGKPITEMDPAEQITPSQLI